MNDPYPRKTEGPWLPPYLYHHLIFLNLYFTKLIFELDFLSISNLIFAGYTGSKNQVKKSSSIIICFCLPGTSSALMAQLVLWHQTLLLFYFMVFFARNADQVITKLVHYDSSGETGDSVLSLLVGVKLEWVIASSGWNIHQLPWLTLLLVLGKSCVKQNSF